MFPAFIDRYESRHPRPKSRLTENLAVVAAALLAVCINLVAGTGVVQGAHEMASACTITITELSDPD